MKKPKAKVLMLAEIAEFPDGNDKIKKKDKENKVMDLSEKRSKIVEKKSKVAGENKQKCLCAPDVDGSDVELSDAGSDGGSRGRTKTKL